MKNSSVTRQRRRNELRTATCLFHGNINFVTRNSTATLCRLGHESLWLLNYDSDASYARSKIKPPIEDRRSTLRLFHRVTITTREVNPTHLATILVIHRRIFYTLVRELTR